MRCAKLCHNYYQQTCPLSNKQLDNFHPSMESCPMQSCSIADFKAIAVMFPTPLAVDILHCRLQPLLYCCLVIAPDGLLLGILQNINNLVENVRQLQEAHYINKRVFQSVLFMLSVLGLILLKPFTISSLTMPSTNESILSNTWLYQMLLKLLSSSLNSSQPVIKEHLCSFAIHALHPQ